MKTTVSSVWQPLDCKAKIDFNLSAIYLKKGASLLVQLAIVTYDTLIQGLIIKN